MTMSNVPCFLSHPVIPASRRERDRQVQDQWPPVAISDALTREQESRKVEERSRLVVQGVT
jgi:hypothetical protein